MNKDISAAEAVRSLQRFDTPTVCNAIELFGMRARNAGYMDGRIKANFPDLSPMVGYAVTATFRASEPAPREDVYSQMDRQIAAFQEISGPWVVVFQDLDDPPAAATFGEVMCTVYKAFGCAGLITSGAGRDLEQVERLGFPVFSSQTICGHGYCHILEVNIPVQVGGIRVHPGDLLHGDRNGVTTIPDEVVPHLQEACEEYLTAERALLEDLRADRLDLASLREAEAGCVHMLEGLTEHLRVKVKTEHDCLHVGQENEKKSITE